MVGASICITMSYNISNGLVHRDGLRTLDAHDSVTQMPNVQSYLPIRSVEEDVFLRQVDEMKQMGSSNVKSHSLVRTQQNRSLEGEPQGGCCGRILGTRANVTATCTWTVNPV